MNSVVLLILDGWGTGRRIQANPFFQIPTPTFDWLKTNFPYMNLQASGIAVGLPWGDPGSSEIGHLTLGAGRILYQNHPRITLAIRDKTFFSNEVLLSALRQAKQQAGRVHLVGLVSSAKTHSSLEHLEALLKMLKENQAPEPYLHLVLDGKESLPQEARQLIPQVEKLVREQTGKIVSLVGRRYAMDTNEFWARTQTYFDFLLTGAKAQPDFFVALENAYSKKLTDEFVEPVYLGTETEAAESRIKENDLVIFWNFREDGLRQLALSLSAAVGLSQGVESFSHFDRTALPKNLQLVTLTEYDDQVKAGVMFAPPEIANTLAEVLSREGLRQLKLGESIKAQLLTYYFNGLRPQAFENEYQIILPSEKLIDMQKNFKLKTEEIVSRLLSALEDKVYHLIVVNLANLDAAGHQVDQEVVKNTIVYMDEVVNRVSRACLNLKTPLVITSDHGNLEQMTDPFTGQPNIKHTDNPVPFIFVDSRYYKPKSEIEVQQLEREIKASLADVAPTILEILGISKPKEMRNINLLRL